MSSDNYIVKLLWESNTLLFYSDVDECEEGLSDRCGSNSVCNNTVGSYTCSCNYGYSGDGTLCTRKTIITHLILFTPEKKRF